MIVAVDVHYRPDDTARAAAVAFARWTDAVPARQLVVDVAHVAPYRPGAFYERELPCLDAVLASFADATTIVVDAYVDLADGAPGLGRRAFLARGGRVPVVGVAKTRFAGAPALAVLRGTSRAPLLVSAAGVDVAEAGRAVASMHGAHRLPTLLARVDALARRGT